MDLYVHDHFLRLFNLFLCVFLIQLIHFSFGFCRFLLGEWIFRSLFPLLNSLNLLLSLFHFGPLFMNDLPEQDISSVGMVSTLSVSLIQFIFFDLL